MTDSIIVNVDRTLVGLKAIKASGFEMTDTVVKIVLDTMPLAPSASAKVITRFFYGGENYQEESECYGKLLDPHTFLEFLKILPKDDDRVFFTQWPLYKDRDISNQGSIFSYVRGGKRVINVHFRYPRTWFSSSFSFFVPLRMFTASERAAQKAKDRASKARAKQDAIDAAKIMKNMRQNDSGPEYYGRLPGPCVY